MKNSWKVVWVAACAVAVSYCGSDDDDGTPGQPGQVPPPANFAGRFEGTEQGTVDGLPIDTNLTITLTQNGNQVTGSYSNGLGDSGTINATVVGNSLNPLTATSTGGCVYSGNATLNGERLNGTLSSPATEECSEVNLALDLIRQIPAPTPTPVIVPVPVPGPPGPPGPSGPPGPPAPTAPPATPTPTPTAMPTPSPSPSPSPSPTPVAEADWSSVTLTTRVCTLQNEELSCQNSGQFRVTDQGNFSASPSGNAGSVTEAELLRLDSRIDAIKEEAHDDFFCLEEQVASEAGFSVSLTFENRPNAEVYRRRPEAGEVCWSGDRQAAELLLNELTSLEKSYAGR